MKKNLFTNSAAIIIVALLASAKLQAQNSSPYWSLAGNSNTASTSKLGTTNNVSLRFYTNNVQRMIINSAAGFVGIGTTTPTERLHVNSASGTNAFRAQVNGSTKLLVHSNGGVVVGTSSTPPSNGLYVSGNTGIGTATPVSKLEVRNGALTITNTTSTANLVINRANSVAGSSNQISFQDNGITKWVLGGTNIGSAGTNNLSFYNYDLGSNALTILNSSNNVGIGTTSPGSRLVVTNNTTESPTAVIQNLTPNVNFNDAMYVYAGNDGGRGFGAFHIAFFRPDGGFLGAIGQQNESSVFYRTTSDKRLKTNIHETRFGLADVNRIQVRDYNFINGKNEQTGFIAQQLYDVFPEAVSVGGEDPKKRPWMVDYGRVTPLLVKAIQDLSVQSDAREATITALQQQVNNLVEELKNLKSLIVKGSKASSASLDGYLKQNVPNPANNTTVISYYLPDNIRHAQIKMTDMNGKILKTMNISGPGKGTLNVDAAILSSGAYNYSLFVNGKLISTKQMERLK